MARSDASLQAHKACVDACVAVREYAGSAAYAHVLSMLDALMASYLLDLIDVQPDGLIRLQAAIKQVDAIRDVVSGDGQGTPKI